MGQTLSHSASANVSFTQATTGQLLNTSSKQLFYTPFFMGNLYYRLTIASHALQLSTQYQSLTYTTQDNDEFLEGFYLVNFRYEKELKIKRHTLRVYAAVFNVLDRQYEVTQWRPMPGRNYRIGISFKINNNKINNT